MRGKPATAVPPPSSPPTAPPPPPSATPTPAKTKTAVSRSAPRRFQLFNLRALWGLFDLVAVPLLVILAVLVIRSGSGLRAPLPPLACDNLDAAAFTPTKFERGLGGELGEDTLFVANTEYLIQSVLVVPQNRRLLVQPGARLEFEEDAGIEVQGALYVCGSQKEPVTLTAAAGKPGSWQGIRFLNADDSAVIAHALVQFAGDRALYLENSAPTLLDMKIANSSGFPISSDGSQMPRLLDGVEFDRNPFDGIEIRGGQTADKQTITWPNQGFVYVVSGPLTIGENSTLTIEPGTNVKFWYAGRGDFPGLRVHGLLKAERVNFTSVYDGRNEVGGVTYQEARDPQPGDWSGLTLDNSSSQSYLRQVEVRYAGQGQGAISFHQSSPELTGVTIQDSAWYPLSADADSFPTLAQITLRDNDPGDALEVRGGSAVTGRQQYTWSRLGGEAQIVRLIRGSVTVEPEATLVIEPGVVIKFEPQSRLVIRGTLAAVGGERENQQIIFTSLRDDDYGGVTDKNTGPQDPRGWDGLVFDQADDNSILQNALVRYGSVAFNEATPRLQNVTIRDSESAPLWATPNAAPTLNNVQLRDNAMNGLAIAGGTLNTDQTWAPLSNGNEPLVRILTGGVTVAEGSTLQIEPGVIIKADDDGRLVINGGLLARGDGGRPIVFTSLHDDSQGGDTNQKLQEARADDWPGLEISARANVVLGDAAIYFARDGLFLRGGVNPTAPGPLRLVNGVHAVRCDGPSEVPPAIVAQGNEVNDLQCPTR
ncbi:MAG: hypothetical protein KJ069_27505 [Anaerolineae bacterium]|nr:hypothetical protein [Anaerolineae bacterium]